MPNGDLLAGTGFRKNELVVDLRYRTLIRQTIVDLDPGTEPLDDNRQYESRVLNLALLGLTDFDDRTTEKLRAAVTRATSRDNVTQAGTPPAPEAGPEANLDRLLYCLRRVIGGENGGWFPEMGKNRDVVVGQPHLSGTGDKHPTRASRPADAVSGDPYGAGPTIVGVLDTKIYDHRDLSGSYDASNTTRLTVGELNRPRHFLGHATFVAGLIRRYAPAARMHVRSVLSDDNAIASAWDVAQEMAEFRNSGVKILCMAMGTYTGDGQAPLVLSRAIEVLGPDVLVVAPAGNRRKQADGKPDRRPMWPAALPGVVAVGAVTQNGAAVDFSPGLPWINLNAWGVNVVSTFLPGTVDVVHPDNTIVPTDFPEEYADWSGSSFALAVLVGRLAAAALDNGGDARKALDDLRIEAETARLNPSNAAVPAVGKGGVRLPKL
jgi:membrane-anchored mycosin MYCP